MNVIPGQTFEAYSPELASGLTGTVGVRIRDGAGADFLARTTASITADVTVGSNSVYRRTLTAPTTAGQYWIVWDDGTNIGEPTELLVTYSAPTAPSGSIYVTRDALKVTLEIGDTYADTDIDDALAGACRVIDSYKRTRFYPTTETRYYTGNRRSCELEIDDANAVTAVTVDIDGDGTFETTWVTGTDFALAPVNAPLTGEPYRKLVLLGQAGRVFPVYLNAVKVDGSFGWAEAPAQVVQATKILAARYLKRARETPYGILTIVGDAVAAARLGKVDPDVAVLLDSVTADPPMLIA